MGEVVNCASYADGRKVADVAVPTMIAGIYGMNFEFMPELHFRWGYELAIAAMGGASLALYARFKRAGWL
jgi:magnesium transporter